jgi:hypothetical protein
MPFREDVRLLTIPRVDPPIDLGIPLISQKPKNNWCWVACAAMVLTYRKVSIADLCLIPGALGLGRILCCSGSGDSCDRPASIKGIRRVFCKYNIPCKQVNRLTELELRAALSFEEGSPVEIGYTGSGFGLEGGGHVVLVVGVNATGSNFFVNDPLADASASQTYDKIRDARGGTWSVSWESFGMPLEREPDDC